MQIPEFLCRGLGRGGYLPVRRIKVAVFTIGNADRAAIVLPYKRPLPATCGPGLSSLNTTIRCTFLRHAHHKCPANSLYAILCFDCAHLLKMPSTVSNLSNLFFCYIVQSIFFFSFRCFFFLFESNIFWVGNIKSGRFQRIKRIYFSNE